jgi:hypothetical protein
MMNHLLIIDENAVAIAYRVVILHGLRAGLQGMLIAVENSGIIPKFPALHA